METKSTLVYTDSEFMDQYDQIIYYCSAVFILSILALTNSFLFALSVKINLLVYYKVLVLCFAEYIFDKSVKVLPWVSGKIKMAMMVTKAQIPL